MPTLDAEHFLEDYDGHSLPWAKPAGAPTAFETDRILFGNGDNALEVAIASTTQPWPAEGRGPACAVQEEAG